MNDSFRITYVLSLQPGEDIAERIDDLRREQSAELPAGVIKSLHMEHVTGSVAFQEQLTDNIWRVGIDWPRQNHSEEITQFLNVLFGNVSLKQGIAIESIDWKSLAGSLFRGPAFGIQRLREQWNLGDRALSCTALKPMGTDTALLAERVFSFALGGIDIIKDDHGLVNQTASPFVDRVTACVQAVQRAAQQTGKRTLYYPNITGDSRYLFDRYRMAADLGADGVLLSPMLTGLSAMHELAHSDISLPIMAHPAFSGSMLAHPVAKTVDAAPKPPKSGFFSRSKATDNEPDAVTFTPVESRYATMQSAGHGFAPDLFYGGLWRALGADVVIYPNAGGRFSFSAELCQAINEQARNSQVAWPASFPAPAGGLKRDTMGYWLGQYGHDTVFLMGGDLYADSAGIQQATRAFVQTLHEVDLK